MGRSGEWHKADLQAGERPPVAPLHAALHVRKKKHLNSINVVSVGNLRLRGFRESVLQVCVECVLS